MVRLFACYSQYYQSSCINDFVNIIILLTSLLQDSVKKTAIIKDTEDPIFTSESFQFKIRSGHTFENNLLEVSVIDKKVIFPKHQSLIGKVMIDLSQAIISKQETNDWYFLVK